MKTALTELIERLEKEKNQYPKYDNAYLAFQIAKMIATELLEKEKEQIVKAYDKGVQDMKSFGYLDSEFPTGETYYKENYDKD